MRANKIILMVIPILLIGGALSIEMNIEMKPKFVTGEIVKFDYSIISEKDQHITYLLKIDCPNAPVPLLELNEIFLEFGEEYSNSYKIFILEEEIKPQKCKASIVILEPTRLERQKTFTLETSPSFTFKPLTCTTPSCTQKSKTFLKGEPIYLDYSTDVTNPAITATLTFPNKNQEQILLPHKFTAQQTGTHTLEVTASKENYKTVTKETQLAVISKNAEISSLNVQELKAQSLKLSPPTEIPKYLIIFLTIIILAVILFLTLRKKK
ncbi:MAG: hypothetical protein KJ600_01540 [Nanoarchaeota archaeon]|nr:hypothetical protein [Nanoarchaeota archaeon]MBU1103223.1 hypothetical protein [Nanoarchaeota archaeon]